MNNNLPDRWQQLAASAWTSAHNNQWLTAMILANKPSATWRVVSDDTATKLRGAWQMYQFIRQYRPQQARTLRRQYEYRRFYELFLLWHKYEFSPEDCIEHLQFDGSTRGMVMQCVDIYDPNPEWQRKAISLYKLADIIYTSYDVPDDLREWIGQGKIILEKYKNVL